MPRRIRAITLLLVIGAAINVAGAWACVAWGTLMGVHGQTVRPATARPDVPESGWLAPVHLDWPVPVPTDWPEVQAIAWSASFGVEWRAGATGWDDPKHTVQALWAGWPMASMRWVQREVRDSAGVGTLWSMGVGPLIPRAGQQGPGTMSNSGWATGSVPRRLPTTPVWPGFAANSLLYTGVAWLAVATPRGVVRWRRRKRGQCTRCGYPIGVSSVCTECGAPVAPIAASEVLAP